MFECTYWFITINHNRVKSTIEWLQVTRSETWERNISLTDFTVPIGWMMHVKKQKEFEFYTKGMYRTLLYCTSKALSIAELVTFTNKKTFIVRMSYISSNISELWSHLQKLRPDKHHIRATVGTVQSKDTTNLTNGSIHVSLSTPYDISH